MIHYCRLCHIGLLSIFFLFEPKKKGFNGPFLHFLDIFAKSWLEFSGIGFCILDKNILKSVTCALSFGCSERRNFQVNRPKTEVWCQLGIILSRCVPRGIIPLTHFAGKQIHVGCHCYCQAGWVSYDLEQLQSNGELPTFFMYVYKDIYNKEVLGHLHHENYLTHCLMW